ncbi:cuticle protein 7 [Drosophila tropicalis]|uniref:cuticle protein 7 n=1 Tax=Drosophila tropicalis TaxID=46794 RepID=UPI0035AC0AEF
MIAQTLFVLGLALSVTQALPIDPYGPSLLAAPAISYATGPKLLAAPAISYAAPKLLAAPAISYAAPKLLAAPAISYATAPKLLAAPTLLAAPAPALAVAKVAVPEPYDPNPQYSFSYGVTDQHTGDSKQQEETLVNGVVQGSYSLAEPDGTIRKVTYTADKINGFNAIVEKKGTATVAIAKPALAVAAVPALTKIGYASAPGLSLAGHY